MAVEILSRALFASGQAAVVVAVELPKSHATMHLDTIMTVVDRGTFVLCPCFDKHVRSWTVTQQDGDGGMEVKVSRNDKPLGHTGHGARAGQGDRAHHR
jgi:arginine deiminase